jgi:hypothetical protein
MVCVFITAGPSTKLFAWGGGGYWEDIVVFTTAWYGTILFFMNHKKKRMVLSWYGGTFIDCGGAVAPI